MLSLCERILLFFLAAMVAQRRLRARPPSTAVPPSSPAGRGRRPYRAVLAVLIAALAPCCLPPGPSLGGERVALVIGNASYRDSPLANPLHDAGDLAALLERLGFTVMLRNDLDLAGLKLAMRDFGDRLGHRRVGLFYYAGHAAQLKGRIYLLPVNCTIDSESDVEFEGLDTARVLAEMEDAGNEVNVVILDACRNNPFARSFRSYDRGLARIDAPRGTLIAYAAAPGSVALDGKGRNGVFTRYLLENLQKTRL